MRRLKHLFLMLFALWLPIQAANALAMPFCRHAAEPALQGGVIELVAEPTVAHCHEQAEVVADSAGCDNCEMCHLATAGYLPTTVAPLIPAATSVQVALPVPDLFSHIGDPPQQPPRRTN
jgi:hypothetical protein